MRKSNSVTLNILKISKNRKSLTIFLAALALVLSLFLAMMPHQTLASDLPDLEKTGSITVTLKDGSTPVSGGEITLYQVALATVTDGDYSFSFTNGFENCGIDLSNLEDSSLASELEAALSDIAASTTLTTGSDGKAVFTDLTPGLYLFKQTKAADGYESISSFLVSLPQKENGSWIYEVDASPKMEDVSKTPTTPKKTTPPPSTPTTLPQTGQLVWPIPVLAVSGLLLILLGYELTREKKTV